MLSPFTILIDSLFAACISVYYVEVLKLHNLRPIYKKQILIDEGRAKPTLKERLGILINRKPLTCSVCLSAWVGLIVGLIKYQNITAFYPFAIGGVIGLLITKYLYNERKS
jgi:hypothetical protein